MTGGATTEVGGRVRPPEAFMLPRGYRQQTVAHTRDEGLGEGDYWNPERIEASARYQWHVYRWAASLIEERNIASVVDVGCGPGTKLGTHIAPVCGDIVGIDQPAGVKAARALGSPGVYVEADLERGDPCVERSFGLVICADVIEHLLDPDPMAGLIRRLCGGGGLVLFSTPDRDRSRGRDCRGSPKPEHVREWAAGEFVAYLHDRGFVVDEQRFLPGDDAPLDAGLAAERAWLAGEAETSPHRCHAVLCRAR